MGEADGSVVLEFKLNTSTAEKELDRLGKKIMQLEERVGKAGAHKNALDTQLKNARAELEKIQSKTTFSGGAAIISPQDVARIIELKEQIPQLEKELEKYDEQIKQGNIDLEYTKKRWVEIANEQQRLRQEAEAAQRAEQNGGATDTKNLSMFERFKERAQEGLESLKKGFIGLGQIATSAVGGMLSGISHLAKSGFSVAKKAVLGFASAMQKVVMNLNVFSKLAKKIGPSISRLGKMIRRVFVFSVITMGLRAMRTQLTSYLSTNTELMTALGRLKGAFLTAFQPIYEAILPALTALINTMTRGIAVAAQFIATLFGTTAKQAQANAEALNEQAKATKNAGDAAKDAQKHLAGFDEIQQIGGGSSGSGAEAGAPIFDYDFEDTAFKSWGEAFSAFLDNILSGIGRLKGALSGFADWMNGVSFNLLEMFRFSGVEEKVRQIGTELAAALNGLVASIDWNQLGQALGSGLNLALLALVSFIYSFDWMALGGGLAESFNGMVSQIDWYELGRLLWAGFKIGLETLAGFLLVLDMPEIAQAASDMVLGFLSSANETISKIRWEEIGEKIAEFLSNVKWNELLSGIGDLISGGINAAVSLVKGLSGTWDVKSIATALSDEIQDFVGKINYEDIGETINNVLNGALDFTLTFLETFDFAEFTTTLTDGLGKAISQIDVLELGGKLVTVVLDSILNLTLLFPELGAGASNMLGSLFEGLGLDGVAGFFKGISDGMNGCFDWIKAHIFDPIVNAIKILFGIHSPSTVMAEIGGYLITGLLNGLTSGLQPIKNFWNGVVGIVESAVNLVIDGINWMISQLNKVSFSVPDWVPLIGGKKFGFNIPSVGKISIPRLAEGAVIPPNREFMAVLGDQKSGNNYEVPDAKLRQLFREELSAIMGSGQQEAVLVVDGEVFGRLSYKLGNRESSRVGVSLVEG